MSNDKILIQVQGEGYDWSWRISSLDQDNPKVTSGEAESERGAWEEVARRMSGAAPCVIVQESRAERKAILARAADARAAIFKWQHFAGGIARKVAQFPEEFPMVGDITDADLCRISSAVSKLVQDKREATFEAAKAKTDANSSWRAFRELQEKADEDLAAARAEGAAAERAAVVEWLRGNPGISRAPECISAMTLFECADAIEAGNHARRTKGT